MSFDGYLGIDAGTQGLTVVAVDPDMNVVATGDGRYEMVDGLPTGSYQQRPEDWLTALCQAMVELRGHLGSDDLAVRAIGVSGQMHGEVLVDADDKALAPARLWCDAGNEDEGNELTSLFGVKVPKRMTVARWLWTLRKLPELASRVAHITTPSGWLAGKLTGQWNLGVGDASGMFPVDQSTMDYRGDLVERFDGLVDNSGIPSIAQLLPKVCVAGAEAGSLSAAGAEILRLSEGIPVAAAEGDQPAALAGSLIGDAGMVSVSFGTSVCANSVGDRDFDGVSDAVDHFCAVDGKPINMVFLRNGTTFMNTMVSLVGGGDHAFQAVMPQVVQAAHDCGGVQTIPFMDDEPGLGVSRGGLASVVGLNSQNATAGNVAKAALLSTMFNLRLGSEVLDKQGFPRSEIILSGGLTRTPELGQLLADVMRTSVVLLDSAEEGTAWGAALLAKFRCQQEKDWSAFLAQHRSKEPRRFSPDESAAAELDKVYREYLNLLETVS